MGSGETEIAWTSRAFQTICVWLNATFSLCVMDVMCHSFTMEWSIWGRETDWWHKRFKSHKRICVLLSSLSVFFIESNFSITPGLVLLSVLIASFYLLPFVRDNRLLALNFPTNINKLGPKPHITGSWHLTWEENIILDEQFYDLLK